MHVDDGDSALELCALRKLCAQCVVMFGDIRLNNSHMMVMFFRHMQLTLHVLMILSVSCAMRIGHVW
jgi:hypothetical protein